MEGLFSGVPEVRSTALVVFGVTGDLMARKIAPALHYLWEQQRLPLRCEIVGFSRRDWTDEQLREHVAGLMRDRMPTDEPSFLSMFRYARGTFEDAEAYSRLAEDLTRSDEAAGECANKLFYLAVPPQHYRTILRQLADSGLTQACSDAEGWTRVLVEKPFGKDAATSRALDELLGSLFREEQVYRIDHYLAKEMLQGILTFRFANNLFEPSWSAEAVERIDISLLETLGLEGRGAFYDGVGALRDVGQNHLLQMLALVTMDRPVAMEAEAIRAARADALRRLPLLAPAQAAAQSFRAQFDGYRRAPGVAPDSETETYFRLRATLTDSRWSGVPFTIESGKRLPEAAKRIVVTFRHPRPCLCPPGRHVANTVTFTLEPEESIRIGFWAKRPGLGVELEERTFDFFLYEQGRAPEVEEYARLLADAFLGDQTLFVSTEEVRAMWAFADPFLAAWTDDLTPLATYEPGSAAVLREGDRATSAGSGVRERGGPQRREIGIVGLGKMGAGIARNLLEHGWRVVGWNRTASVAEELASEGLEVAYSQAELVAALTPPRVVWVMLPAGRVTGEALVGDDGLANLLDPGDLLVDGGNSHFSDTASRASRIVERGVEFVDCGTSGGPAGARGGACLMIGGRRDSFERLRPLWEDLSVPGGFAFFPGHGAGHFVKMVHNGIEYGMMQALAEGFTVLRASPLGIDLTEAARVYGRGSVIASRLVDWLRDAYERNGPELAGISGTVGHTGEGEWTVRTAEELEVPIPVIADALRFRVDSERDPSYAGQVLSALRAQFGGHAATERARETTAARGRT